LTEPQTYAQARTIMDADSHLMELPDFLSRHVDANMKDRIPSLDDIRLADVGEQMRQLDGSQGHSESTVKELLALQSNITRGPKWHAALGSFNGAERSQALDMLGFEKQVVFSSFCATKIFNWPDIEGRYAAAKAHNRSVAEFCGQDRRLIGVAMTPIDEPDQALEVIEEAIKMGLGAMWIPSRSPGGRSPGHPDLDVIWSVLQEAKIPFILHVGSDQLSIPNEWMNDGHSERESARGRAEVIGSKDLTVIFQSAQRFISTLVLDGVLEKFRSLKGGVIELGAGWVPDTIRRLDHAVEIWSKSEPFLASFERKPSDQFSEQLRFTPYPFEDVGQLISESSPDLYLFSTDYPHAEGGRDPIGRFSRTLVSRSDQERELFFNENLRTLYPSN